MPQSGNGHTAFRCIYVLFKIAIYRLPLALVAKILALENDLVLFVELG